MMYDEFMRLSRKYVSYDDYLHYIEPMYMALPVHIDKIEFISMLNLSAFKVLDGETNSEIINNYQDEIKQIVHKLNLSNSNEWYTRWLELKAKCYQCRRQCYANIEDNIDETTIAILSDDDDKVTEVTLKSRFSMNRIILYYNR